ncbi:MAG: ornithine--oxo-acid transaminase [Sterolibacterium sp.]|jgi:ornithine--oxo-acid transaminase|nr:ornithine--oxo-acid transaminase [Sterolibacterium sp.]
MDTQVLNQPVAPSAAKIGGLRVRLIGVSNGYGVPPVSSEGSAQAAQALRLADVGRGVRRNRVECVWDASLALPQDEVSGLAREAALREICTRLEARIVEAVSTVPTVPATSTAALQSRVFPVILSGDHATAEGAWRGVSATCAGLPGLLWIDAHLDAHTSLSTPSGNPHGMPLAALLGCMPNPWNQSTPVIDARRTCVFGARSFESEELKLLQAQGVRIFDIEEIRQRGLAASFAEALAHVSPAESTPGIEQPLQQPFGISLDLDAVDPLRARGVNTPVVDGLEAEALIDALRGLAYRPGCVGFEVSEYNPLADEDCQTALLVERLLESLTLPDDASLMACEQHHGAHNYAPLPVVLTRGLGCYVWDGAGRRYLDMMSAYSAVSFGHAHPRLVAALTLQAQRLAVTSRAYYNDRLPLLLARLTGLFGYEAALPVNTGLEAVETALKAARKWGHQVKGIAEDQAQIIACHGNFHGRSIAITGLSSEPQYRRGFGPFPPGLLQIPYGDAAALEAAITPETAAFLVEPIQGEAGIVVPPAGYLRACADICQRHNVLLICDEVQTGLARTGQLLAAWHEGVRPDGVILGKALGGGLLPVSAFLADRRVMDVFRPGDHGSTFGGNALAAAVALEAIDLLETLELAERATQLGAHLLQRLHALQSPLVKDIRGRGLLVGIELHPQRADAHAICLKLLERGILSKDTHGTVIRIAPPLVITQDELDAGIEVIAAVLREPPTHLLPRSL